MFMLQYACSPNLVNYSFSTVPLEYFMKQGSEYYDSYFMLEASVLQPVVMCIWNLIGR